MSFDNSVASTSPEWSPSIDAQLQQLVRDNLFDFAAVAIKMQIKSKASPDSAAEFYTADSCRLRFALLASGQKPTYKTREASAVTTSQKMLTMPQLFAVRSTTRPMIPATSAPIRNYKSTSSTYVPWHQNQREVVNHGDISI